MATSPPENQDRIGKNSNEEAINTRLRHPGCSTANEGISDRLVLVPSSSASTGTDGTSSNNQIGFNGVGDKRKLVSDWQSTLDKHRKRRKSLSELHLLNPSLLAVHPEVNGRTGDEDVLDCSSSHEGAGGIGGGVVNLAADVSDCEGVSSPVPLLRTFVPESAESISGILSASDSEPEEENFLDWLFRRSSRRKSRRQQLRRCASASRENAPVQHEGMSRTLSNDQPDESSAGNDRPPIKRSSSNLRRSLRKLFRRNESFSRAQQDNDIIDQLDQPEESLPPPPPPRSDSISPSRVAVESLTDADLGDPEPVAPQRTSNLRQSILLNRGSNDSGQSGENANGSTLRRNEQPRRSVRFTLNRTRSSSPNSADRPRDSITEVPPLFSATDSVLQSILRQVSLTDSQASVDSQPSSHSHSSSDGTHELPRRTHRHRSRQQQLYDDDEFSPLVAESDEERGKRIGFWPHAPCSMLAALSCVLGMSNICRFSFLSFQYGGGFILQFLMLSISFGFPMISLYMTMGQYMGSGIVDMWKISPVFQGVGVASLLATALIGIYNIIPISWLFVYFRDSFVTNGPFFKWAECSPISRRDHCTGRNFTTYYKYTVPEYFHGRVLQRNNLFPAVNAFGDLKFENVFNLAVVWMLVFICLSKGIKLYGKVVFAFALFPLVGFLIVSVELLRQADAGTEFIMNTNTHMFDVFLSGAAWVAAAREVFFTWGINGAALMQITSHNRFKHNIKRDSSVIILVTLSTLILASFLGCACFSIIYKYERGAVKYLSSSFESERYVTFLGPNPQPLVPLRYYWSNNLLLGEEMNNFSDQQYGQRSHYQVLRLVTELFPAAVAYLGANVISPFWCVLLYLTLICFGIAQQLAIWLCVVEGIVAMKPRVLRAWETTITFVTCITGFVLGLPLATELGIFVVYFLDFCVGSAWWIMIIYLIQVLALFIVRGKPYSADELVSLMTTDKFSRKWLSNLIAFSWNVITPVGLLVLSIVSFRNGMYGRMFNWFDTKGSYPFWPTWLRQIGTMIQLMPLFSIPIIGMIQTCRYMAKGPPDLFDRLQMLYRPSMRTPPDGQQGNYSDVTGHSDGLENPGFTDDPPPKYTPPPSYNTATGLNLLKRLNSLRRSFRSQISTRQRAALANLADVEMASSAAAASVAGSGDGACCSHSLAPFFITLQDPQSTGASHHPSSSTS